MRAVLAAITLAVCCFVFSAPAEARRYHHHPDRHDVRGYVPGFTPWHWTTYTARKTRSAKRARTLAHKRALARKAAQRNARMAAKLTPPIAQTPAARVAQTFNILRDYADKMLPKGNVSLNGVVPTLAAKTKQIVTGCGSKVISAVRNSYVAGTNRISLHASGRAVDVQGNPSCIYAMLKGWPGGYSIDYPRVNHVHISYGGREHGARFVHGGGRKSRYAKRHNRHYRTRWAQG